MVMENRDNLLACALKLFAERGYDAVGVQEIVETAGVTKPTLYHYFNNKQGLLFALLDQYFTTFNRQIMEAAEYHHDVPLTLQKVTQTYFEFARENPVFYRLQFSMQFASPESVSYQTVIRYIREQHRPIAVFFAQAADDHGNMRGRHLLYTATFIGMINTYIGWYLSGDIELEDQLVYQATHQFMHGIFS